MRSLTHNLWDTLQNLNKFQKKVLKFKTLYGFKTQKFYKYLLLIKSA